MLIAWVESWANLQRLRCMMQQQYLLPLYIMYLYCSFLVDFIYWFCILSLSADLLHIKLGKKGRRLLTSHFLALFFIKKESGESFFGCSEWMQLNISFIPQSHCDFSTFREGIWQSLPAWGERTQILDTGPQQRYKVLYI